MTSRIRTLSLGAACLASAMVVPAAPASAAPPTGTFLQNCVLFEYDDVAMTLSASCKYKGSWNPTTDWSYKYCVGDIGVYKVWLVCTQDAARKAADEKAAADKSAAEYAALKAAAEASVAKQKAAAQLSGSEAAFAAAGVLVLGWMPGTSARLSFLERMKSPEFGMAAEAQDANVGLASAAKFLKLLLKQPSSAELRGQAATFAYLNVYGREPTPVEAAQADAAMLAGTAWYATLVGAEQAKMRGSAVLRNAAIRTVYRDAMGRDATPADRDYWAGRPDDYAHMMAAARAYLYAPAGVTERVETTRRALAAQGKPTTDAAIKAAMIQYGPTKAIYSEMTAGNALVLKLPGM